MCEITSSTRLDRPGNSATVKFLLDRGANPNPYAYPATESSPLIGDAASSELPLAKGVPSGPPKVMKTASAPFRAVTGRERLLGS